MAKFELNRAGMAKLEREIQQKMSAAVAKGEKRAQGKEPDEVAAAVAKELKAIGVEPNLSELKKAYRKAAEQG